MNKKRLKEILTDPQIMATLALICFFLMMLVGTIGHVYGLRPNYIYDEYDLLTDSQEIEIDNYLADVDNQTTCEIIIVIESYLTPYPTMFDMALDYFENVELDGIKGIGKEGKDNGVLVIMTIDCYIMTGYGVEGDLTDAECGRILDNILIPKLDDYKDFDAIILTAEAVAKEIGYVVETSEISEPEPKILWTDEDTKLLEFILLLIVSGTMFVLIIRWQINKKAEKERQKQMAEMQKLREEQRKRREEFEKQQVEQLKKSKEEWWATRPIMKGHCPKCDAERESKQIDTKQSESLLDNVWWWIISYYVLKCLTCGTEYQKEYDRKKYESVADRTTRLAIERMRREEERRQREENDRKMREIRKKKEEEERRESSYRRNSSSGYSGGGGHTGGGGAGRSGGGGFHPR